MTEKEFLEMLKDLEIMTDEQIVKAVYDYRETISPNITRELDLEGTKSFISVLHNVKINRLTDAIYDMEWPDGLHVIPLSMGMKTEQHREHRLSLTIPYTIQTLRFSVLHPNNEYKDLVVEIVPHIENKYQKITVDLYWDESRETEGAFAGMTTYVDMYHFEQDVLDWLQDEIRTDLWWALKEKRNEQEER